MIPGEKNPLTWLFRHAQASNRADAIEARLVRRSIGLELVEAAARLAELSVKAGDPHTAAQFATEARRYAEAAQFLREDR